MLCCTDAGWIQFLSAGNGGSPSAVVHTNQHRLPQVSPLLQEADGQERKERQKVATNFILL